MTSLQKNHNYFLPFKQPDYVSPYIRVRNLSKNYSHKNIFLKNKCHAQELVQQANKISKNYQRQQTSFFDKDKENIQKFSKHSIKNALLNPKANLRLKPSIRKSNSLKLLTKFKSHQILPLHEEINKNINISITQSKKSLLQNMHVTYTVQPIRPLSLKRKVDLIRKKHTQMQNFDKFEFQKVVSQVKIKSQNLLGLGGRKKSKLKLMVRNPFERHIKKAETETFIESIIEPAGDQSLISQDNRKQFEQFLNCIG